MPGYPRTTDNDLLSWLKNRFTAIERRLVNLERPTGSQLDSARKVRADQAHRITTGSQLDSTLGNVATRLAATESQVELERGPSRLGGRQRHRPQGPSRRDRDQESQPGHHPLEP